MAETNSEADDATGRRSIATLGLMLLVRGYQRFGSAWLGGHCRFEPSCSCYAMEALERHGALRGGWLSMRRVLRNWASNGVLLLNRFLSVRPSEAGSHRNLGWEALTNRVIEKLASDSTYRVFCLWGNDAKQLKALIPESQGMIECVHPSPLSAHRGFFGSRPFTAINRLLKVNGQSELDWTLPLDLSGNFEGHIDQLF